MLLTDHVQAIIKSAKSIVAARNFPELAPEHLMLALMLDQNDLPKILFERVGADNPQIVDRLNNYLSKRAYYARGKFSDVRLSADTIAVMNIASNEAEKRNDEQVSIEHLMLALFRIDNKILNYLWEQSGINRLELYEKMTEEVNNIVNVEETQTDTTGTVTASTLKLDGSSKLYIKGVPTGVDLYLKETVTSTGYNILKKPVKVNLIPAKGNDGEYTGLLSDDSTVNGTAATLVRKDTAITLAVNNTSGFQLPATGGMGAWIFAILGVLVIGGGVTFYVITRKKRT